MLTDGEVFDQNERAPLPVDGVVPGFSEGLQLMKRGGKYRLWIPPQLGYGSDVPEGGPIPKDSVLMFDVELLDYVSKAKLMQMQQFRSEEHTSELQSLMRISYAVFCLKKKTEKTLDNTYCDP